MVDDGLEVDDVGGTNSSEPPGEGDGGFNGDGSGDDNNFDGGGGGQYYVDLLLFC